MIQVNKMTEDTMFSKGKGADPGWGSREDFTKEAYVVSAGSKLRPVPPQHPQYLGEGLVHTKHSKLMRST